MLLAELERGEVVARQRLHVDGLSWPDRIRLLERLGVSVILAGGFARFQRPMATARGIRVIWGQGGDVERLLVAFARQQLRSERSKRERASGS
jgi:hypothetical protein